MLTLLLTACAAVAAAIVSWVLCRARLAAAMVPRDSYALLQQQLAGTQTSEGILKGLFKNAQEQRDAAQEQASGAQAAAEEARVRVAKLQAALDAKEEQLRAQKEFLAEAKADMEREFRLIAANSLELNAAALNRQQEGKLSDLLSPFREQIQQFQEAVRKHFTEEGKEKSALQREMELLSRNSSILSRQANSLTEALRGSTKQQGDWGETILERVLEHCGLKEGIDYTVQAAGRSSEGAAFRPDVVLHLVGGRNLVIDAKVSLNAYWDMCSCPDDEMRSSFLPDICAALRRHVDELHRRPYNELEGTPGYLVMFVPVEAAYITALQHDGALWQYAYDRGVLVISPTNLIPFMRMVAQLWDREKKYRNAESIAKSAGLLYDKLVGFVKHYEKVGAALRTAQQSYDDGFGQLATGRGNLIAKAEEMKALRIANKHDLPAAIAERAALADGIHLPQPAAGDTHS